MPEEKSKRSISTLWVFLSVLATSPICVIFLYLGKPGSARAGWILSVVIVLAAKVRWELHDRVWFWPTIILISLVHLYALIAVTWTSKWIPAALIFPFCAVDGIAILWIFQLIEKLTSSQTAKEEP